METNYQYCQWSEQAEQSVIGGIIVGQSNDIFADAIDILQPEHFYDEVHAVVFKTMIEMSEAGKPPYDIALLMDYLNNSGNMKNPTEDIPYLLQMSNDTPSSANVKFYAEIVLSKAEEREVLKAARAMQEEITQEDGTSEERINNAMAHASAMDFGKTKEKAWNTLLKDVITDAEDRLNATTALNGLKTGFKDLDDATQGLQKTDLIIVAARPAMGKTTLAMNIASQSALLNPEGATVIFSLEMGAEQLTSRVICSTAGIKMSSMKNPKIMDNCEWEFMSEGVRKLKDANLIIDDRATMTPQRMRAKCLKEHRRHGNISLIVVDYLQLMTANTKENRTQEVSIISRSLKALAKEFDCPVIALSQLNRDLEKRPNKRPMMADLRESGAIEQDADMIMFLYRDEVYNENSSQRGYAELDIAKFRNGETQMIPFKSDLARSRFRDMAGDVLPPAEEVQQSRGFAG